MNNFKRLQEEQVKRAPDMGDEQRFIRNRLDGARTFGQVVDLYLTKILDLFVVMTGGEVSNKNNRPQPPNYPGSAESDAPSGGPSAG